MTHASLAGGDSRVPTRFAFVLRRVALVACASLAARTAGAQRAAGDKDSVTVRLVNTELRAAVQLVAQYLDRPVLFSGPGGPMVTLETPRPLPRADVPRLLQSLLDSQNYELVNDTIGRVYRARPKEAPKPPQPDQMQMSPSAMPRGAGNIELFVLPLKHARAADVANTVNALYGKGVARTDASRRPTLGDELRQNQIPPLGMQTQPYQSQPPVVVTAQSPNTTITGGGFTGEVTIVPDARANNLLVRANRTDYALIESVVRQLDTRPLQVMIEVLIAEVQRGQSTGLGTNTDVGETMISKTLGTVATGSISGAGDAGLGAFAIKVMKIGGINLDATLQNMAGKNHVAIVSRPVVLTANNQEAEIVVGTQRPFVQVSRSLPTDQAIRDQVVQYKDVGTKLTVRPSISVDGSVELEVKQEVSSATTETAFNAPVISTRSVQTQLLIKDGQTVVLGGLRDRQKDESSRGIPGLSSIPIIGALFGHVSRQTTETELFIFLTPRVIRSDEDAAQISNPLEQRSLQLAP
ncbi:MAG TPA: secretin N-terminal domain-containing protein [Gemmatimonadaceae bacterium]